MMLRVFLLLISLALFATPSVAAKNNYLYKTQLVQAAPGKILEVVDFYKAALAADKDTGDEAPLWLRHSQGDHWALVILIPMKSYSEDYTPERVAKRSRVALGPAADLIAWHEDVVVLLPPHGDPRKM